MKHIYTPTSTRDLGAEFARIKRSSQRGYTRFRMGLWLFMMILLASAGARQLYYGTNVSSILIGFVIMILASGAGMLLLCEIIDLGND